MNYTQSNFRDGTEGWKARNIGNHPNNPKIASWIVYYTDDEEQIVDHVYEKEDALLIAAAPDMYEALKSVEKYLEDNSDILAPFPTRSELDQIRRALEKARGEKNV